MLRSGHDRAVWSRFEPGSWQQYAFGITVGLVAVGLGLLLDGLDGGHEGGISWLPALAVFLAGLARPVMATVRRRDERRRTPDLGSDR